MADHLIADYFEDKPQSHQVFMAVKSQIERQGPSQIDVKSQISLGVNRKFAWFWLYNVTKKNPSGILHLMLALDHQVDDPKIRDISQVGKGRWNHQIVIRTLEDAESEWLGDLIAQAHAYGSAEPRGGGGR
ncbi:MAG: hypothetical protein GEU79_16215 [Acidimicrobiia bacterium]|nr:hypothetical protein [Acidimicrobiia bacterium]